MPASSPFTLHHTQNFLHNRYLVADLLDRSSVGPDDVVFEIGPGHGIITEQLARRCRRVVAVEKDPVLARRLQRRFSTVSHVTIVEGDVLDATLPEMTYKVFANIPFNGTAAIVRKITAMKRGSDDSYLVVQREAAGRFLGLPDVTLCSVLLHPWFAAAMVHRFCRADFQPPPGVDVVLMRLRKRGPPLLPQAHAQRYRDFVSHCFTAWRPSALQSLARIVSHQHGLRLARALGFDPAASASQVMPEQWLGLYQRLVGVHSASMERVVVGAERRLRRRQAGLVQCQRTRSVNGGHVPYV